ncbi:MAG: tRNA uridine-5-carboxymethylaminomethyl(34) synthesis GTPase MnmE [Geobacter sp.]|nr:tRNA uridine-5-carboxymethylaminomethyl(34) synthesis GTPase MnmE [Geobacter sp.]
MYIADTIAAISTPLGEGGIGILRISGPDARRIAERIFLRTNSGGLLSHRFYYGEIVDPASLSPLDEGLMVFMRAPRSFTREDVVELHCHGGYLLVQQILALILNQGARLAAPGEFTRRAFLNGRIDLLQAESVIDVIRGKTDAALALAQHQREGRLSRLIAEARQHLVHVLALLEAYVDFPEDEIGGFHREQLDSRCSAAQLIIAQLLGSYDEGRVLRDGVSVLIAGKPNAGKSSLLNTLLREKRAIVTAIPGTTRDMIQEVVNIGGLPVTLIDTAGVRETGDEVEQEGVRRTMEAIPRADLVLFLVDGSRPYDSDDELICTALTGRRFLLVKNKSDLTEMMELPTGLSEVSPLVISTKTGAGIEHLKEAVCREFLHGRAVDSREFVALSRARHRDALVKCQSALVQFGESLAAGLPPEIVAVDLREALSALGEVTGETTPDEVLDLVFSQFCVGK